MKSRILYGLLGVLVCAVIFGVKDTEVIAETASNNINMNTSNIVISEAFGSYQSAVDKNIYNTFRCVDANTLVDIYGDVNTEVFQKAKEYINPCMAFATTWGEAGQAYAGISMTTVMDFDPSTYRYEIDWITLAGNLQEVDDAWYIANAVDNYNTNEDSYAYHMPVQLLQFPRSGSRATSMMTGLGVGPYQITSSDWDSWELANRVSPIEGFKDSLKKTGTSWINCGINPTSDLTVYALLSLGHQGGGLIDYDFGKRLINKINEPKVQEAFNDAGRLMYLEMRDKAYDRQVTLSDINVTKYLRKVEAETGVKFSSYTGGVGRTNKGNYVALHCLRYVFYKNYFTNSQ